MIHRIREGLIVGNVISDGVKTTVIDLPAEKIARVGRVALSFTKPDTLYRCSDIVSPTWVKQDIKPFLGVLADEKQFVIAFVDEHIERSTDGLTWFRLMPPNPTGRLSLVGRRFVIRKGNRTYFGLNWDRSSVGQCMYSGDKFTVLANGGSTIVVNDRGTFTHPFECKIAFAWQGNPGVVDFNKIFLSSDQGETFVLAYQFHDYINGVVTNDWIAIVTMHCRSRKIYTKDFKTWRSPPGEMWNLEECEDHIFFTQGHPPAKTMTVVAFPHWAVGKTLFPVRRMKLRAILLSCLQKRINFPMFYRIADLVLNNF